MLRARERADFVAAVRALDRVLISGCYVVPLFYLPEQWVARWAVSSRIRRAPRFRATCPKPGGANPKGAAMIPRRCRQTDRRSRSSAIPRRITPRLDPRRKCSAARRRAARTRWRWSTRRTARRFTDGAPRQLTYAEADRMVSAIAGRLRLWGCRPTQLSASNCRNTVENVLTLLGVLRAGMIAAPLPLLWRRADAVAASPGSAPRRCSPAAASAIRPRSVRDSRVAADVFSIRYVCGFGGNLPDGVVPFDDLFAAEKLDPVPPIERRGDAVRASRRLTFDIGRSGIVPVARRHLPNCLAGGLAVLARKPHRPGCGHSLGRHAIFLCRACLTLLPWLLSGGTLVLHQPFDAESWCGRRGETR